MRSTQCAVEVLNSMAFGVEKCLFFVGDYLKTELFGALQSDSILPIRKSRASIICDMEVCETVQPDKIFEGFRTCSRVTEIQIVRDWGKISESHLGNLLYTGVVAEQRRLCICFPVKFVLFSSCSRRIMKSDVITVSVAFNVGGRPSHVRRDFILRRGVVPSCRQKLAVQPVKFHSVTIKAWCDVSYCTNVPLSFFENISNSEPTLTRSMNSAPEVARFGITRSPPHWSRCPRETSHTVWMNWKPTDPT